MTIERFTPYKAEEVEEYMKGEWWLGITLGDAFDRTTKLYPNKEALVDDKVRLTYFQLREKVDMLVVGLINLGITKGDAVLLQLPNWAEFVYSYFALQKIGGIPVLLTSAYKELEVSHFGRLTSAKAWIVPCTYRKIDYTSFIGSVKKANPQLDHIISVRASSESGEFTASIESLIERESNVDNKHKLAHKGPEPTDVCHILPSGGTTGLPKGIPRTHNDYICNVRYGAQAGKMGKDDIWLVAVPVGHNLALLDAIVPSLVIGGKLLLVDSTRPEDICRTIQRDRATYMPTVPSLLKRIVNYEELRNFDLSSLKRISAGGEPSSPELIRATCEKLRCKYINEFGMSEGLLCRTTLDNDIDTICTTVGIPCCPRDHVKIIDENGRDLPVGTDGELATKGPCIFTGYLRNPEENAKAFLADGFFKTGDLARIDKRGYIKVTGRIKDIIIRGGENISPAQVEEILLTHREIADAAVIGMPDKDLGERVCAYIQPAAGVTLDPQEIEAFMASKGASSLLIPERFEFVDVLPITQAEKHDKKALRADIEKRLS